jgi:pSer/pThr/pTyr-binding forkhead associated (FHA) protein
MNVKLVIVQGKPAGKAFLFVRGEYYLGRGPECYVRFNSDWVSRQHCLLRVSAAAASLRDLGSRNGTLVNGTLLTSEHLLAAGDQVQIGPVVFEVSFDDSAEVPSGGRVNPEGEKKDGGSQEATEQHPIFRDKP